MAPLFAAGAAAGTLALPGGGTLGGALGGCAAGGQAGATMGGALGGLAAPGLAAGICATDDERDKECQKRLEREETLCRLLAGSRYPGNPEQAIRICARAAFQRYAECLRGTPESEWPPLTGVDTPI